MEEMENKELLLKKRHILNVMLESIEESWSTKKFTYKTIILVSLVGLLICAFGYYRVGALTVLDAISISILTSIIHLNIRDYLDSRLEYGFKKQKLELKLSELEQELDQ